MWYVCVWSEMGHTIGGAHMFRNIRILQNINPVQTSSLLFSNFFFVGMGRWSGIDGLAEEDSKNPQWNSLGRMNMQKSPRRFQKRI